MSRLKPEVRREQILQHAVEAAQAHGYRHITREDIARRAGVTVNLISHYFGTMPKLKRAVMREAIRRGDVTVLAQGLAAKDPHAQKAPLELKRKAVDQLLCEV